MMLAPTLCLARAMSPLHAMPPGASEAEVRKLGYENYYNSFLNVRDQREYVACLEKENTPDSKKSLELARKWLEGAQAAAAAASAGLPKEKLIVDAAESYVDENEKHVVRRVVVTTADGQMTVYDHGIDKMPPPAQ